MSQEKVQRNKQVYKDRQNGMSLQAIATKYGVSKTTIQGILQVQEQRKVGSIKQSL